MSGNQSTHSHQKTLIIVVCAVFTVALLLGSIFLIPESIQTMSKSLYPERPELESITNTVMDFPPAEIEENERHLTLEGAYYVSQIRAVRLSHWALIISIASTIIAAVGLLFVTLTLRSQNQTLKEQMKASTNEFRAFLEPYYQITLQHPEFDDPSPAEPFETFGLVIDVALSNKGRSNATDVRFKTAVESLSILEANHDKSLEKIAPDFSKRKGDFVFAGGHIEQRDIQIIARATPPDVQSLKKPATQVEAVEYAKKDLKAAMKTKHYYLLTHISYRCQFSQNVHHVKQVLKLKAETDDATLSLTETNIQRCREVSYSIERQIAN